MQAVIPPMQDIDAGGAKDEPDNIHKFMTCRKSLQMSMSDALQSASHPAAGEPSQRMVLLDRKRLPSPFFYVWPYATINASHDTKSNDQSPYTLHVMNIFVYSTTTSGLAVHCSNPPHRRTPIL